MAKTIRDTILAYPGLTDCEDFLDGNYIQSYSITLIKRCKDLLLSNLFITFAL